MAKDIFTKDWIISNSLNIVDEYEKGVLTIRALHYQLVGIGMTNDIQHYKRVVNAMIDARWNGLIDFDTFSDLDREMVGETEYEETILSEKVQEGKDLIKYVMTAYNKNRWENQPYYPEVFIEKKALQGVFAPTCKRWAIALGACKGYPSLTFLNETQLRFEKAIRLGKKPIILYFGDYDPSGEDIPRSIQANLERFGVEVEVRVIALNEDQVTKWNLPPAPAKVTDTRTAGWVGLGQVELDAVNPKNLMALLKEAIEQVFDYDLFLELREAETDERDMYRKELAVFMESFSSDDNDIDEDDED